MRQQNSLPIKQTWSFISHEMRTPLNAILGYAQMMLDDPQHELPEVQLTRVSAILRAGRRLQELLNSVSRQELSIPEFSMQHKGLQAQEEEFDLVTSIRSAIELIGPAAGQKNIRIHHALPDERIIVAGKASAIDHILLNLLDNAVKYNRDNGSITIACEKNRRVVTVTVEDSGIGIPEEKLAHIFKPFYRIEDAKDDYKGSGIGLAVVRELASFLNGTVGVESSVHNGSTFWFALPLKNSTSKDHVLAP
jgi:signal transduction histidine kinase